MTKTPQQIKSEVEKEIEDRLIVEVFSGKASFSKVAKEKGFRIITIDINEKFNPTLRKDVLEVGKEDIKEKPFVMWFSPVCIDFSHAKRTGVSFIDLSNMYVIKCLNLIVALEPKYWIIENPQTGTLKFQYFMKDISYTDVSYCKYGFPYRKQTRLWNNFGFTGKVCNNDCNFMKNGKHINSIGNGRKEYTSEIYNSETKGEVPEKLCSDIIESIMNKEKSQLSILTEYDKAIKEMTENNLLRETAIEDCKWLKENMINVDNDTWIYRKAQWDCLVEFFDLTEQELLSKIGDNSEVKE